MTKPFQRDGDLWLWIGLGIAGIYAFYSAREHLYAVREAARVTNEEPPADIIGQHTEDGLQAPIAQFEPHFILNSAAISVDTLGELYNSPNWDIKQASTRIIVERLMRNGNLPLLLRKAKSKNPSTRDKALSSLRYLVTIYHDPSTYPPAAIRETVLTPKGLRILINVLISFLPQNHNRPHTPHTDWKHRTPPERDALAILSAFIRTYTEELLTAGLVSRWLRRYPFGGRAIADLPDAKERELGKRRIVREIGKVFCDDEDMGEILGGLDLAPEGRRQLRKYGLIGSAMEEAAGTWIVREGALGSVMEAAARAEGAEEGRRRERREESEEEVALRRRRRQAMVISEQGEPLSRESIIESVEVEEE